MNAPASDSYILGTDREELHRLGLQHEIWSAEASRGWESAGFGRGQTLLDLGCGPGFCTQELAYLTGPEGTVIGVDLSRAFIDFARRVSALHQLDIDFRVAAFDELDLEPSSLDGVFCRWALAWVPNPADVVRKVAAALKPGGVFLTHEYIDWAAFRVTPNRDALRAVIDTAFRSFSTIGADIDIGLRLPSIMESTGLEVIGVRSMSRTLTPGTTAWQWPDTFFHSYLPRLVKAGQLEESVRLRAMEEWGELSGLPETVCHCPTMVEVMALQTSA